MEELKTILQQNSISEARQIIHNFVYSAEGFNDKLKLMVGLISLFEESTQLLNNIDTSQFVSQLRQKVEVLNKQSAQLSKAYQTQLLQNENILKILYGTLGDDAIRLQQRIEPILAEYDQLIKLIVKVREQLPIQTQMKQENKTK